MLFQDTGMEAYKHFAFGRSSSALHWVHHLTLLGGLPWYYKYQKVRASRRLPFYPPSCELVTFAVASLYSRDEGLNYDSSGRCPCKGVSQQNPCVTDAKDWLLPRAVRLLHDLDPAFIAGCHTVVTYSIMVVLPNFVQ